MRFAVILLVLGLGPASAWPCPASNDLEYRCTKYDFMFMPVAQVYVRDTAGELPRRKVNVMKHLTSAGWHSRADQGTQQTMQVFDAANVPDTYEALGGIQVFAQALDKVEHVWRVSIDGAWFQVMRCKEHDKMRTCLVRT